MTGFARHGDAGGRGLEGTGELAWTDLATGLDLSRWIS